MRVATRLLHKSHAVVEPRIFRAAKLLQNNTFSGWAMPYRTSDLCRANANPFCRRRSPLFKKACKITPLSLEAFVGVRYRLRGLVYYWCTDTSKLFEEERSIYYRRRVEHCGAAGQV